MPRTSRSSIVAMRSRAFCRSLLAPAVLAAAMLAAGCSDDEGAVTEDDVAEDGGDVAIDTVDDGVADAPTDVSDDGDAPPGDQVLEDVADLGVPDIDLPLTCVAPDDPDRTGTAGRVDDLGTASVTLDDAGACYRSYTLSTTADLRDDLPNNPRTFAEEAGWPTARTGHDLFDALFALALAETRQNAVRQIREGTTQAIPCGEGGCFETGRLWTDVWTRDTAYSMHLGLAALDPVRARNSLAYKTSERREGGDRQIIQDTGSGGSYPVSSDRVVWAMGARAVLDQLTGEARTAFRDLTWDAVRNTIEHDRIVVFDSAEGGGDGLYRGETSFLDWREQTYPDWTEFFVIDIAMSKALSTNVAHAELLALGADLAAEAGDAEAAERYEGWHDDLVAAIRERFWLDDDGMLSAFVPTDLDPAPVRRYDLLGVSLAIITGVATPEESELIVGQYPTYGPGAPVIWPQQQRVRIYHNRAEWPFVTAYWLRAGARASNDAVVDRAVRALMRGAALNLSNMENFEAGSGSPDFEDGQFSGPVVNSQRQLWSVAGYVSMVHHTIFGLQAQADGLRVAPTLTAGLRDELFSGTDALVLNDWPFRGRTVTVVLHLPAVGTGDGAGVLAIDAIRLNGVELALQGGEGAVVPAGDLYRVNRIDVDLGAPEASGSAMTVVSDEEWRAVFGPRTPRINGLTAVDEGIELEIEVPDENRDLLTLSVYRDGERIATGLAGSTTIWIDTGADVNASPCYAVEATFNLSGTHSQHSRAECWWGEAGQRVTTITAEAFTAVGGEPITNHGLFHYQDWGDAGDTLTVTGFSPDVSGRHLLQTFYGNGSGPVNTGITCAVKRVTVYDESDDSVVGGGLLVMPQLGMWARWWRSNFVPVELDAARSYRIVIGDGPGAENMSVFEHFATYGGEGGEEGPYNRVNIAQLIVLARP